jgi:peroxiredoxin
MNVQVGQILLENREAEFLACAAGRPFHDADDALRIELHLHVQIAGCQLNAVLDAKQFGVLKEKNMYGKKVWGIERTTFVIGPDQTLLHVFPKVTPAGHAEEVLALLKEWKKAHK